MTHAVLLMYCIITVIHTYIMRLKVCSQNRLNLHLTKVGLTLPDFVSGNDEQV